MDDTRTIEIDSDSAELLEREAQSRGLTVRALVKELALEALPAMPLDLKQMREAGQGPWSPEALAEDARTIEEFERAGQGVPYEDVLSWMKSWGTSNELPMPRPRKL